MVNCYIKLQLLDESESVNGVFMAKQYMNCFNDTYNLRFLIKLSRGMVTISAKYVNEDEKLL